VILDDFNLYQLVGKSWINTDIDSLAHCVDPKHFKSYPYAVEYLYNSRGFRDREWPDDLSNCVWCFGDSFTVGLGSPVTHTWPSLLEDKLNQRCINVSLNGASNFWIARKVIQVLEKIKPKLIVIHWTFTHRIESHDSSKSDEDRRQFADPSRTTEMMLFDFFDILHTLKTVQGNTKIIHSFIPDWSTVTTEEIREYRWNFFKGSEWPACPKTHAELNLLNAKILKEVKQISELYNILVDSFEYYKVLESELNKILHIPEFIKLDFARDGYHYDIKTATKFVNEILTLL
jgi:hypothetical protein